MINDIGFLILVFGFLDFAWLLRHINSPLKEEKFMMLSVVARQSIE